MSLVEEFLERPLVYRLWQAPFASQKMAPFRRNNEIKRLRRVLDIGCGPGTNASYFPGAQYLGLDINPRYIRYARRHYQGQFEVADATRLKLSPDKRFDCILVNSLLHHLTDEATDSLLSTLGDAIAAGGFIHILELVRPGGRGLDAVLARADRGQFSRRVEEWTALARRCFELTVVEHYVLGLKGITLWNMVYLKGRPR